MGWVKDPPFWLNDIVDSGNDNGEENDSIVKIEENSLLNIKTSSSSDSENSPIILLTSSNKVVEIQKKKLFFSNMLQPIPKNYSHVHIIQTALILTPLWFIANCFYNYALYLTSIGSSTVISTLAGVFTLFFSWYFGIEIVTKGKIIGLILCILGVIFVSYEDDKVNEDGQHSFIGDFLALLGAMGYGIYTTILGVKMKNEEFVSMQLLLGYLGVINIILLSPVLIFMGILHAEELHMLTISILGYILLTGFFDNVISDYLWARSVILTSPTVATVGLSLTIPLAIVTDVITGNHSSITYLSLVGASFVLGGFFLINLGLDPIYKCLGYQIDE